MARLHLVSDGGGSAKGAVIFVHGLGGDPFGTWMAGESRDSFWPKWLAEDVPDISVHTLEYDAAASNWFGSALALPDRATNVMAELEVSLPEGVPIVFVCHSLGGLVTKQILRNSIDAAGGGTETFAHRTNGIIFAATPNAGSNLAGWMDTFRGLLRPTEAIEDMKANGAALLNLNDWYRDNSSRLSIETLAFVETRKTKNAALVVTPSSANPGIAGSRAIPIDADHFGICKPENRQSTFYKQVQRFVMRRLDGVRGKLSEAPEVTGAVISNKVYDVFLSHSSAQKPWVEALAHNLLKSGRSVFLDSWCLVPGRDFIEGLKAGLAASRSAILVVSPESHHSGWVREEYDALKKRQTDTSEFPIIPVVHSTIEGDLPYTDATQWIDFRLPHDYRTSFARLLCGLEGSQPGPYPGYDGPLDLPDEQESENEPVQSTRSIADETFEALFNTKVIIILAQDGSFIGELSREIKSRATERYGAENVNFIVPTNIPGDKTELPFFSELARQAGLGDGEFDANLFHQKLSEKLEQRRNFCLIMTGIEHVNPGQLEQLAGIIRAVDMKHERFRFVSCGGEKLCDLKYANGVLSFFSHAGDIRWPEPGIAEVIAIANSVGRPNLDTQKAEIVLRRTGGHFSLIREFFHTVTTSDFNEDDVRDLIANSSTLWSALIPLVQDPESATKIREFAGKQDLGPAGWFILNPLLRKIYWHNLITERKNDGGNRLVWRSSDIQAFVRTIVSEI